jgi:glycosyltransferase involved in cell wall biosynthesis
MKLLMLSDHTSTHTKRWVQALSERGVQVYLFSLVDASAETYDAMKNVQVYRSSFSVGVFQSNGFGLSKLRYLAVMRQLKRFLKEVNPDLVHAHYATSYGLLGSLLGFKPYVLSVWGTDVFQFPGKSILHKALLKFNLNKATQVLSTSQVMANETRKYTQRPIEVTPFGVDLERFRPNRKTEEEGKQIVIGTIKSLEHTYGIDLLIHAFSLLITKHNMKHLKLLIVGGGTQEEVYRGLVKQLNLTSYVVFSGRVAHEELVNYYNRLDVYVALSRSESFGVAVLEASACELPVLVSNVGGLPEVVVNEKTGYIIPPEDPEKAAEVLSKLIGDDQLRKRMGHEGRQWVQANYSWDRNVDKMMTVYREMLDT